MEATEQQIKTLPLNEIKQGFYLTSDNKIARVKPNKYGDRLYAMLLNEQSFKFEYSKGTIYNLVKRLELAEAIQFGQRTGHCCICGRLLTNELSVELGIGPICGGRL